MKKQIVQILGLATLILMVTLPQWVGAEEKKSPFQIKMSLSPETLTPDSAFSLNITFSIAPNHYLYSDKIKITPNKHESFSFSEPVFEKPLEKIDPFIGKVLIYKEKTTVILKGEVLESETPYDLKLPVTIKFQGCTDNRCFMPETRSMILPITIAPIGSIQPLEQNTETGLTKAVVSDDTEEINTFQKWANRFGLLGVLVAAFVSGILISLTPCVYPMTPIISASVIRANSSGKLINAFFLSLTYVAGMSLVYAFLGVTAAISGSLFGAYTNHPITRIVTAVIFVTLGLSMLGLFEIKLPPSLSAKLGGRSRTGGVFGVLVTGAVSGAIIGPCVGPVLLALITYIATIGDQIQGFFIMWSFGLGLGLLFLVIGTFSGAASMLPRSGGWMESVKSILGLFLMGFALYYIKPILPEHFFFLSLGVFLIGIAVFTGTLDFLARSTSPSKRILRTIGIVILVIGITYVVRFAMNGENRKASLVTAYSNQSEKGIPWMKDEAKAFSEAKTKGVPLIVDFYADWCTSCVSMDKKTFSHSKVVAESSGFVWLKIDCTQSETDEIKAVLKKYNIKGLPTILFYDKDGKLIKGETINDYVGPKAFLKKMDRITG